MMTARQFVVFAGAIAGLIVATVTVADFFIKLAKSPANLELVSAQVSKTGEEIDVKVRNTGGQVAVVDRATFRIAKHSFVPVRRKKLTVSAIYDVEFPIELNERSVEMTLSQSIGPGESDRILIRAGVPAPGKGAQEGIHRYETTVVFYYSKKLSAGPLSLSLFSGYRSGNTPTIRYQKPPVYAPISQPPRPLSE